MNSVTPLEPPDTHHLSAAIGWLELGNPDEANQDLARISSAMRVHPEVLEARWQIHARASEWEACVSLARQITRDYSGQSLRMDPFVIRAP